MGKKNGWVKIMTEPKNPGEDKAWDILATLKPEDVCRAADATWDAVSASYTVKSFGMDFIVSYGERSLSSNAPGSEVLLGKLGYFFRLAVLWYLVNARDIACTGRIVKLEHIKGGEIFTRGSHVLPLDSVANKYGRDKDGFLRRGAELGGEPVRHADASVRLRPLPRVPVIIALWLEDDEFPARVDLLFDSTCDLQLPTDIIWSVAMMTVLMMG
jgi:hypothetical protein